jgi:hypothetical protein
MVLAPTKAAGQRPAAEAEEPEVQSATGS